MYYIVFYLFCSFVVVNNQAVIEDQPLQPIPVALDNLPPQHSAIFLFGCQVMRLLSKCPLFPPVLLLIAKSIPVSSWSSPGGLLAHCSGDFHFDTSNQILYLSEARLQHVGQFIATILQAMAYVASGDSRNKRALITKHTICNLLSQPPPKLVCFPLKNADAFISFSMRSDQSLGHRSLCRPFIRRYQRWAFSSSKSPLSWTRYVVWICDKGGTSSPYR